MIFRYRDGEEIVRLYDVVRPTRGVFKDLLCIIVHINKSNRNIDMRCVENGLNVTLSIKSVSFCYRNTKAAAKQWFNIMDYNLDKAQKNYSNLDYIRKHWKTDNFIINDITIRTIVNYLGVVVNKPSEFVSAWIEIMDLIYTYNDFKFCREYIFHHYKDMYDYNIIDKLYKMFHHDV